MDTFVKIVGSVFIALFLIAIPVLTAISYFLPGWNGLSGVLTVATVLEFCFLTDKIFEASYK